MEIFIGFGSLGVAAVVGIVGFVAVIRARSTVPAHVIDPFTEAAVSNGLKIDGLGNQIKLQHGTMRDILTEQRKANTERVRISTILERNGRSH